MKKKLCRNFINTWLKMEDKDYITQMENLFYDIILMYSDRKEEAEKLLGKMD